MNLYAIRPPIANTIANANPDEIKTPAHPHPLEFLSAIYVMLSFFFIQYSKIAQTPSMKNPLTAIAVS